MAKYTREYIESLKEKDRSLLTPKERQLVNLNPVKPGQKHHKVQTRGGKHWSTIFRRLLNDEKFLATIVSRAPKEWEGVVANTPAEVISAGLIATVATATVRALAEGKEMSRSTREAITLINKIAFGDKVTLDAEDGFFSKAQINFNVVSTPTLDTMKQLDEAQKPKELEAQVIEG